MAQIIIEMKEYEILKHKAELYDKYIRNHSVLVVDMPKEDMFDYNVYIDRVFVIDNDVIKVMEKEVLSMVEKIEECIKNHDFAKCEYKVLKASSFSQRIKKILGYDK